MNFPPIHRISAWYLAICAIICYHSTMHLAHLHLDTHRLVKHLESRGYTEEQAEGFIEAVEQIDLVGLATKEDIKSLQRDLNQKQQQVKEDASREFSELRDKFSQFRSEIYKAMFYQSFAVVGLTVTLLKFIG